MYRSILIFLLSVAFCGSLNAQEKLTGKSFGGSYYTLFEERGSMVKFIQLVEVNNVSSLLVAPCAQCVPAMYEYEPDKSKKMGRAVYFNMGIYIINYNADSFVIVMPPMDQKGDYLFANFYSKNSDTIGTMTKDKIIAFTSGL